MRNFCLAAFAFLAALATANAQFGVSRPHASFGGKNYYYSFRQNPGFQVGWDQASNTCRSLGMSLLSIDSPAEASYIAGVVGQNRLPFIWTSGRRFGNGWVWSSTGRPFTFTQWSFTGGNGRPQPDNREGGELCMAVLNNVYGDGINWHDIACHHQKPFICQTAGFAG